MRIICKVVREPGLSLGEDRQIVCPSDVAEVCAKIMDDETGDEPRECFVVFHVDTQNRISSWEIVTMGVLNASLVHPREIFRSAILRNAAAIIIAHNHPSGNVRPSSEDIEVTRQLKNAGETLGIPLLDHLITSRDENEEPKFTSLVAEGIFGMHE